MRACVLRGERLVVDEVPEPRPAAGQVLVRSVACGICGSDVHFLRHARAMVDLTEQLRPSLGDIGALAPPPIDLGRDIVMGHEFCAEVLEHGPGTTGPPPGTLVVSMPVVVSARGVQQLAYNNEYPGGFAERMVLSAPLLLPVPAGVDARAASLTEPLAVGIHAVAVSGIGAGQAAAVAGCGPVGLAVIAALSMAGVAPVVAADPSPARRAMASRLGATEVVDPRREPLLEAWRRVDGRHPLVAFEAVGVPGVIDALLRDVPRGTTVTVVGVCMEPDTIQPFFAVAKELTVRFAMAYGPDDFRRALAAIVTGAVDVSAMVTGTVDLDGVPGAFEALARPDEHVKILVTPAAASPGAG